MNVIIQRKYMYIKMNFQYIHKMEMHYYYYQNGILIINNLLNLMFVYLHKVINYINKHNNYKYHVTQYRNMFRNMKIVI